MRVSPQPPRPRQLQQPHSGTHGTNSSLNDGQALNQQHPPRRGVPIAVPTNAPVISPESNPNTLRVHAVNSAYWRTATYRATENGGAKPSEALDAGVLVEAPGSAPARSSLAISKAPAFRSAPLQMSASGSPVAQLLGLLEAAASTSAAAAEQPPDLLSELKPYQKQGLGKTVQAISLILAHRTDKENPDRTSTLVVTPLPLLRQWESEILRHSKKGALSVYVHHGPRRLTDPRAIQHYDVVLTTLATLASDLPAAASGGSAAAKADEFRSPTPAADGAESDNDDSEDSDMMEESPMPANKGLGPGPLLRCRFLRIIVDEAHVIKNQKTKGFAACCAVDALRRLCLTGTPIQNNVDELQSLFAFLRIKPYDSSATFKAQISRPMRQGSPQGLKRLRLVLEAVMLRRTKQSIQEAAIATSVASAASLADPTSATSKAGGLDLPDKTIVAVNIELSKRERNFYKLLETRVQRQVKLIMKDNGIQMADFLGLLLRLRQACNHPCLVGNRLDVDAIELDAANTAANSAPATDTGVDELANLVGSFGMKNSDNAASTAKFCKACLE
ncbi:hypothetical protein HK405_009548, partial [Cladochytrium tenue]